MSIMVTRTISVAEYEDAVVASDHLREGFIKLLCEGSLLLTAAEARDIADSLYLAADEADLNSEGE